MGEFYPFFIILFAGVFLSSVFRRFRVPWVISLIIGGIFIGPHGLNIIQPNETLSFIAQIGLIFLMFMAGLEVNVKGLKASKGDVSRIALLNGSIPFFVGFGIGYFISNDFISSALLGIIFISSSIAVIIPSLEVTNLIRTRVGTSVIAATVLEDSVSLVLLSFLLHSLSPVTNVPLIIFYPVLLISLLVLRWLLPKLQLIFSRESLRERDVFQQEIRSVFLILVGTVIIFEVVGLHPIIAGFFAGLVLSGSITSKALKSQLRTLSYGIFIPTFFVMLGMKTDIGILGDSKELLAITLMIVLGSMLSKVFSGWLAGKISGFSSRESWVIGFATMPQLSTTLAVVFTGVELGLLDARLASPMIILSILTVFIAPVILKIASKNIVPYKNIESQ